MSFRYADLVALSTPAIGRRARSAVRGFSPRSHAILIEVVVLDMTLVSFDAAMFNELPRFDGFEGAVKP